MALQMARLATYHKHKKIVKMLMKEYRRVPPENFHSISIEQVHTADHEIFMWMSEVTESGLDSAAPGSYPLDEVIDKVVEEPRIKSLLNLFPMAKGGGGSGSGGVKRDSDSQAIQDLRAENKKLKTNIQAGSKSSSSNAKGQRREE